LRLPATHALFLTAKGVCKGRRRCGPDRSHSGERKRGPRYDPSYPDPDAYENLILMCGEHHKTIDTKPLKYQPILEEWKRRHEERFEQPSDEVLEKLTVSINEGSIVTSINQQGGRRRTALPMSTRQQRRSLFRNLSPLSNAYGLSATPKHRPVRLPHQAPDMDQRPRKSSGWRSTYAEVRK